MKLKNKPSKKTPKESKYKVMSHTRKLAVSLKLLCFGFFFLCYLFLQISIAIDAALVAQALTVSFLLHFILLLSLDCSGVLPPTAFGSFPSSALQLSLKADYDLE